MNTLYIVKCTEEFSVADCLRQGNDGGVWLFDILQGVERARQRRSRLHQFGLDKVDARLRPSLVDDFEGFGNHAFDILPDHDDGKGRKDAKGS